MRFAMILVLTVSLSAKDKKPKSPAPDHDSIEVVGHIPAANGAIRRFLTTDHFSSHYLYAESGQGSVATLIDVTRPNHPAVLAQIAYPTAAGSDSLVVVSGTAALAASGSAAPTSAPQTVRIFDFSDPQHPQMAREFLGVTAMTRDECRGLLYLANADGVWILRQNRALDPEVEKAYEHQVIYNH